MQPARKLLSLLFLVLMGTELTQVRAFNAIFLRACEAPARPPASPAKSGSSSARPVPLPRRPSPAVGVEGGRVQTNRDWRRASQDPQPWPSEVAQRAPHSLPRSSNGSTRGSFSCCCYLGGDRAGCPSPPTPRIFRGRSDLTPTQPPTPRSSETSLPLVTMLPLALPKQAMAVVPLRPDPEGQAVGCAGLGCFVGSVWRAWGGGLWPHAQHEV